MLKAVDGFLEVRNVAEIERDCDGGCMGDSMRELMPIL